MERYSKTANSKALGMTLLELELFVMTAKQAGLAPGSCLKGETTISGKLKNLTATNNGSPQRHSINT